MPKRSFHDMNNSESSSHTEAIFDTQDDHLVSDLYRGSITAVPGAHDTELYVWGCPNQIDWIVLDWRERRWKVIETAKNDNAPGTRHAHSATYFTMLGEAYIAVLGGADSPSNDSTLRFADVYIYDIKHRLWLSIIPESESQENVESLTPRLFHSATFVEIEHDPYLVVVGGIFNERTMATNVPVPTVINRRSSVLPELRFFNLRLRRWSHPIYIPGRYRHSAVLIPSSREPKLMILGGRDKKGNLSKETILINLRAAFQTLKYHSPLGGAPPEDHGAGIYWSHLAGVVQPLGPYVGSCHATTYADSVIIFGHVDRSMHEEPPSLRPRIRPPRGPLRFQAEPRPRPPEPSRRSSDSQMPGSDQTEYSGWALSFDGGSASFRELRRLRRVSQKAECAVQALPIAALPITMSPPPPPPAPSKPDWLWTGTVKSGWGTSTGGQEDLFLLMYQANKRTFLVPVLLSALAIQKDDANTRGSGLGGLLPPLWNGVIPQTQMGLDPAVPPFGDFALKTSTPGAPPIILHRSILLARSVYFRVLLTSGFTESRTGQVQMEETYPTLYALAHWIYTGELPGWIESPSMFPDDDDISTESRYASHAGETLCELLIAANARMVPTLVHHVRQLLRSHMHIPELAPLIWRAMELTGMDQAEEVVPFGPGAGSRRGAGSREWIQDVVGHQLRPTESQRQFGAAVVQWCCGQDPEVGAAMEDAKEWLEPGIWKSWEERCAKIRASEAKGDAKENTMKVESELKLQDDFTMLQVHVNRRGQHHKVLKVPELLGLICSFARPADCVNFAQTCKPIFKVATAFVWSHVDNAQNLLTLLSGTLIIIDNKIPESRKVAIGVAASAVDFSRFDFYAPYVKRLTVYGHEAKYFQVSGWSPLMIRANSRPLLPNLLSMVMQTKCDSHGPDQFMWIKAFSGPSPPRVSPLAASAILDTISTRCPRLLRLSLFVSETLGFDKYDGENNMFGVLWKQDYYHYFRALPALYELSCSVTMLQSDSLNVIGSLPYLTRLSVYSSGGLLVLQPPHLSGDLFPSLNELSLQDISPYEAASIMQIAPLMKRLTLMELITNPDYLDFDELREDWITGTLLQLLSNAPRLNALHIDLDPLRELDEPYDIGHQDVMDTFSKLPLISLTLSGVHIGDWASTGSLKTIWPLLSSLRMRNQYASPLILTCFAQLPRLQHLTLSTLEISDGVVTMMEPEDLEHTSRFLLSLFPRLRRIVWTKFGPDMLAEEVQQRRFIGFLNQHLTMRRELDELRTRCLLMPLEIPRGR
ncbi:unnamed protein product [Rhizoctonia solani]|uniref:BTB domain-containing protein n=1 Tax=Rhizoctonia solani TaxID=456999 RepID=A0A8H3CYJ4_9AGAM|nr:unnamed protein product [Rhizoctonia solani]